MGPASPFFIVQNHDDNEHIVSIEVLNSGDKAIITETYVLEPKSDVSQKRSFWLRLPLSKGDFTFNVTMDNETTELYRVEVPHPHAMIDVGLYYQDYTGNMTPINVQVVAVA